MSCAPWEERNENWEELASVWGETMTTPAFIVAVPSGIVVPEET
jgi:hypothetical protein